MKAIVADAVVFRSAHRERGFTLLEVIVVLLLMGIVTGLAVLSLGSDPSRDQVRNEGRRLAAILGHQRDLAMLRLEERGLLLTETGYQVLRRVDERWQTTADEGVAAKSELPEGLSLEISVAELPATLSEAEQEQAELQEGEDEDFTLQPQIWIFSTGELLPFRVVISDFQELYRFEVAGSEGGLITTTSEIRVE